VNKQHTVHTYGVSGYKVHVMNITFTHSVCGNNALSEVLARQQASIAESLMHIVASWCSSESSDTICTHLRAASNESPARACSRCEREQPSCTSIQAMYKWIVHNIHSA
jgi:hypothetical protein